MAGVSYNRKRMSRYRPQYLKISFGANGGKNPVTALLDKNQLAQFSGGDAAMEREILGFFHTNAQDYIADMEQACTSEEWKQFAHKLKGAARSIGAMALGELAEEAELVADQVPDTRHSYLPRLRSALAELADLTESL